MRHGAHRGHRHAGRARATTGGLGRHGPDRPRPGQPDAYPCFLQSRVLHSQPCHVDVAGRKCRDWSPIDRKRNTAGPDGANHLLPGRHRATATRCFQPTNRGGDALRSIGRSLPEDDLAPRAPTRNAASGNLGARTVALGREAPLVRGSRGDSL